MSSTMLQLHCSTELELDLLVELMAEYELTPHNMKKTDNGIDLVLEFDDKMDRNSFYSKLMLYNIYYKILRS